MYYMSKRVLSNDIKITTENQFSLDNFSFYQYVSDSTSSK